MLDIIAFLFDGRFNCTRRMLPDCSARISSIVHVLCPPNEFLRPFEFEATAIAVSILKATSRFRLRTEWRRSRAGRRLRSL